MQYAVFYDQVMAQIVLGHAKNALIQLSGMLDATRMVCGGFEAAGEALQHHELFALLKRAQPVSSQSGCEQKFAVPAFLKAFDQSGLDPTARLLFEAMLDLPPVHAVIKRADHAGPIIAQAWQDGRSICLMGEDPSRALHLLEGRDHSNIHICASEQWAPKACYDLIYAPDLLFETAADDVAGAFSNLASQLTPDGLALLTSLIPDHLGTGWRQLCLNWEPNYHTAKTLTAAAHSAGLKARFYDDPEGCILWCELVRGDVDHDGGITS